MHGKVGNPPGKNKATSRSVAVALHIPWAVRFLIRSELVEIYSFLVNANNGTTVSLKADVTRVTNGGNKVISRGLSNNR